MKKFGSFTFLSLYVCVATAALGQGKVTRSDVDNMKGLAHQLPVNELKSRLEIQGEIFVFDASGRRLLGRAGESRKWTSRTGTIESNWSSSSDNYQTIALHHVWKVNDDGTIQVLVEQYDSLGDRDTDGRQQFKGLLQKREFNLQDFAPVQWVSLKKEDGKKVVVRLTPSLRDDESPKTLSDLPFSGSDMIVSDNDGRVWTENTSVTGKYVGIETHRGSVYFSYVPFEGATEIGVAKGTSVRLKLDEKRSLTVRSTTALLPNGVAAKVFGIFKPDHKTSGPRSTVTISTDKEPEYQQRLKAR